MSSNEEKKAVLTGRGEGELAEYSNELNKVPLKQFSLVQKKSSCPCSIWLRTQQRMKFAWIMIISWN